jgi:Domain of unknown function (DUF1918)
MRGRPALPGSPSPRDTVAMSNKSDGRQSVATVDGRLKDEMPTLDNPVHAQPGDTLVIDSASTAGLPRVGIIIAVIGQDGSPPFLVRWITGDYESRIIPGPGARIEVRSMTARRAAA